MRVLRESAYLCVPWKNGGGVTREILRHPPEPAAFDWRLSLATIDRAGPFSAFSGYHRTLVLVRGAGVELTFGAHGSSRLSVAGDAVSFDGAWETQCTLLDGPSTDLNLIVSNERAKATSRVLPVRKTELVPTDGWLETWLCCVTGRVEITNSRGAVEALAAVDVAQCLPSDGVLTCRPEAPAQLFIAGVRRSQ